MAPKAYMKRLMILSISLIALCLSACNNDDDEVALSDKSWLFTPDDGLGPEKFTHTSGDLFTYIYQVLQMNSEEKRRGTTASQLKLLFKTVGPPPSGTYRVTSRDKLNDADQVAIECTIFDDARTQYTIESNILWYADESSNQTITYKFENGKASAYFKDIVVTRNETRTIYPNTAKLSAKISQ